jgi:hypothetical protein
MRINKNFVLKFIIRILILTLEYIFFKEKRKLKADASLYASSVLPFRRS